MAFNFDEALDRRHSDSVKWNKFPESVLPLWVADMDYRSPPCITDALTQRIAHGVFGYGVAPNAFFDAAIAHCEQRYGWQLEPSWLVVLPGVVTGLNLCVRAFSTAQEVTLAPTPIYPPFRKAAALAGRGQHNAPLVLQHGRPVVDYTSLEPLMSGQEKLLMLCNPQNPGGTVYTRAELQAQLAFAQRHNLIVCSDEIHCDLVLDENARHIPFATLSEDAAQRSITLMSPSKTYNIAGLGASLAIIPNPELRRRFMAAREGIVPTVDILALTAGTAAWREGEPWREELLVYLRANRDRLVSAVNNVAGLQMHIPQATYLGWIDASGLNADNPAKQFHRAGLGVSPGADFGELQYVRVNFGCTKATLEQALSRLQTLGQQR
ncbi:putative C-S lyase [Enterobacteriaceae bacterium 4M9]|nr:putative C-S lyase [Enterobacteriaceae bacterium 4M9]